MPDMSPPLPVDAMGDFLNGAEAALRRVGLTLLSDRLRLSLPDGGDIDWPLEDLRALKDQADPAETVLHQVYDPTARLLLRDADFARRIAAVTPNLANRPPVENKSRIATWAAGAVASVALIVFVLVPIMANQLAAFLPPEGERALGDATFERIRMALSSDTTLPVGICSEPDGLAALAAMEARLNASEDLPYPVTVAVLDHDLVNAFALPGGRVIVFRGLIDEAENPDEIAAILAHEIGHIVNRDPTRDALRLAGSMGVLGLLFGDFAGGTVVLFMANQLINMTYSRAAETGADDYAHAKLSDAGLPPAALGTYFERLKDEHGDAEGIAAHFSTHPQMAARIAAALAAQSEAEAAGRLSEPSLDDGQWQALRAVCGSAADDGGDSSGESESEGGDGARPAEPPADKPGRQPSGKPDPEPSRLGRS